MNRRRRYLLGLALLIALGACSALWVRHGAVIFIAGASLPMCG
jgi:hypothetical protein